MNKETGLKDKNGRDIFNDDVVVWRDGDGLQCQGIVAIPQQRKPQVESYNSAGHILFILEDLLKISEVEVEE